VTRDFGSRHREAHVGEEALVTALADVPLGLLVRLGRRGADRVDAELLGEALEFQFRHKLIVPRKERSLRDLVTLCYLVTIAGVKAIRIHEDGGPEVLRYEDAPDPEPGPGDVLIRLRATSLNHIDLWVRGGRPSAPKPRILGADGAGTVESGPGFAPGDRVVMNPGIDHGDYVAVYGEHMDGTDAELVAVPRKNVYPIPDGMSFEEAAAFPLVFVTAYRMLVTRAGLKEGETVLIWGIGGGVAMAANAIARALGAKTIITSSRSDKLARVQADAKIDHAQDDVVEAVKEATEGKGADVVVEHVGEATWQRSLRAARTGGRIVVCGATSGPNPPAALHRIWWKQLSVLGSTMGTKEDFDGVYELVASGRARPVVDEVFPLSEARAAHERMEAGEQLGKIVLTIPG
jgi:zinc-binding alcohol dehydrogenase/oxidoreductase